MWGTGPLSCLGVALLSLLHLPLAPATDAYSYLTRFAYMGNNSRDEELGALTDPRQKFEMALKKFQRMANIEETGTMNADTKYWMELPRCGNEDSMSMGDIVKRRRRRYTKQGSKWGRNALTYKILNFSPDLDPATQRSEIRRAFQVWSDVTPLTFREVTASADIELKFGAGNHGDAFPFDGSGGTLAHAFFPQFGGDVHMDEDETFSARSYSGTNLFQVLAHELGHSLGLGHSDDRDALMAPFYRGYVADFRLHVDDERGIQAIYGRGATTTTTTRAPWTQRPTTTTRAPNTPAPSKPGTPDICLDGEFDAITRVDDVGGNARTFMFRKRMYARLTEYGIESGYPRYISDDFPGLPDNIDAAVYWPARTDGTPAPPRTYFFKGAYYWRYEDGRLSSGYPREIRRGFPGMPDDIDAAFMWSGNGKTYFIKGDNYYRYKRGEGVDAGYPRPMRLWKGVPSPISCAFQWTNGRTYFFSGPNYFRFNDRKFAVDTGYPRLSSYWWLGCPDSGGNNVVAGMEMSENEDQFMEVAPGQGGQGSQGGQGGPAFSSAVPLPLSAPVIALYIACGRLFL